MRYYLITTHQRPKFYRVDGSIVDVELPYVQRKEIRTLNAKGELQVQIIKGCQDSDSLSVANGIWMVENTDDAIAMLGKAEVYPFESKDAARQYAKQQSLSPFKYLTVP